MKIGKHWPIVSLHYCGWDKTCRSVEGEFAMSDGTTLTVPANRRINLGWRRHFFYFNITDWSDRGRHTRSKDEYKRLRKGLTR